MPVKLFTYSKCIVVALIFTCFCSCNINNKNEALFKVLDEGLTNSNEMLQNSNLKFLMELHTRLEEPTTREKVKFYMPTIEKIAKKSIELNEYIDTIKKKLITNSSEVSYPSFISVNELYSKLIQYQDTIFAVDTIMKEELKDYINSDIGFKFLKLNKSEFEEKYLKTTSNIASIAALSKIQNAIQIVEFVILEYYLKKTSSINDSYDVFRPIISQSSSNIKTGEKIEILAGIGAFTSAGNPQFFVNKKPVSMSPDGATYTSIISSTKAGKHSIPVTIEYTKPDGSKATITKKIIYNVDSCR